MKRKNIWIFIANILYLIFDIFIIGIFIASVIFTIIIPIILSKELDKCCRNSDLINVLLTVLSISFSCFILPIISAIVSTIRSNKNIEEDIEEVLAKVDHVKLYLIVFPLGLWHDLSSAYQRQIIATNKSNKALSDYNYALHLHFEGEIFQAYDLQLKSVSYSVPSENSLLNKHDIEEILFDNTYGHYITSDITGVEGIKRTGQRGTNITVLFDDQENQRIEKTLLNPSLHQHKVCFDIKFERLQDNWKAKWLQFFECHFPFPIIRGIYRMLLWLKRRYQYSRISICLDGYRLTDDRASQFEYDIYDVDIEKRRSKFSAHKKAWILRYRKKTKSIQKKFKSLEEAVRYAHKRVKPKAVHVKYLDGSIQEINIQ